MWGHFGGAEGVHSCRVKEVPPFGLQCAPNPLLPRSLGARRWDIDTNLQTALHPLLRMSLCIPHRRQFSMVGVEDPFRSLCLPLWLHP